VIGPLRLDKISRRIEARNNKFMIKKNTKIIFEDGENKKTEEMPGGIPLSVGEIVHFRNENNEKIIYEVIDKTVEGYFEGKDRIVDIIYVLRKK